MSRPTKRFPAGLVAVALAGAVVLAGVSAPAAWADDDDPREHYLPPLPPEAGQVEYGLNPDPYLPRSIGELKQSPEPSCAAPALPAPTDAGSPEGYTVPLRLKLSNGVLLAGYSSRAKGWGDQVPFSIIGSRITGWVVARVSLPSMKVTVAPADVTLCPYVRATDSGPTIKALQSYALGEIESQISRITQGDVPPPAVRWVPFPDTTTAPFPGTLGQRIAGLDKMGMTNMIARELSVRVSGVAPDGSLEMATDLDSTMDADPGPLPNGNPNPRFLCRNMGVTGTFGTAAKDLAATAAEPPAIAAQPGSPADFYRPRVPKRQDKVYLPTRNLTGAIEGGTATIGSNSFTIRVPKSAASCGGVVNTQFYGYGFHDGGSPGAELQDLANFFPTGFSIFPPPEGYPIVPGLSDLSLDVTVDAVGLPKRADLPAGYGFE